MDMMNCFNGMFGKLGPGMCRLTMNGRIAVKTSNGYKSYNVNTGKLTNCSNFVFDIGDDFFFSIPTNRVAVGDIILVKGTPRCVIEVDKKTLKVMNYEDMTIDTLVPERHVFMGNTYFYGRIVSFMGANAGKGKKGMKQMMQFMVMNQMMRGNNAGGSGGFMNMGGGDNNLPMYFMMMNSGGDGNIFDCMFEGMFDFDSDDEPDVDNDDDEEEDDE